MVPPRAPRRLLSHNAICAALLLLPVLVLPAGAQPAPATACGRCIRAEMQFLASDAMRGRGSGTHDEQVTATYVGAELERYGIAPAGDDGTYVETATLVKRSAAAPPVLSFAANGAETRWAHGAQIIVLGMPAERISGPLQKLRNSAEPVKKGAFVLFPEGTSQDTLGAALNAGAAMLMMPAPARYQQRWSVLQQRLPAIGGSSMGVNAIVLLNPEAVARLSELPDGSAMTLTAQPGPEQKQQTWNAVGILRGSDPELSRQVVLLTAHLDHLGVGQPVNGDEFITALTMMPRARPPCWRWRACSAPASRRNVPWCLRCSAARKRAAWARTGFWIIRRRRLKASWPTWNLK